MNRYHHSGRPFTFLGRVLGHLSRRHLLVVVMAVVASSVSGLMLGRNDEPLGPADAVAATGEVALGEKARTTLIGMPLLFEQNVGQSDPGVQFLSQGLGYSIFFSPTELVMALPYREGEARQLSEPGQDHKVDIRHGVVHVKIEGGNPDVEISGVDPVAGKSNYFIGSTSDKWHTGVTNYEKVRYHDVYPGIDLIFYGNQGTLEYDFVVAPGADPSRIRLKVEGAENVGVNDSGNLVMGTAGGELQFKAPVAWQEADGARRDVDGQFTVDDDNGISLALGDYDPARELIIDPVLLYGTYFGGASSEFSQDVAVDADGNLYLLLRTTSMLSADYTFGTTPGSGQDGIVVKLNPYASGAASYLWSARIGGDATTCGHIPAESLASLDVDATGQVYMAGFTGYSGYPVTANAYQSSYDCATTSTGAVVTVLHSGGNTLLYSSYLLSTGGAGDLANGVAVDRGSGHFYVTGYTQDAATFPVPTGHDTSAGPGNQAYLAEFDPLAATGPTSLVAATFLDGPGGIGTSAGEKISVLDGLIYIAGTVSGSNLETAHPYQPSPGGGDDAFLYVTSSPTVAPVYATYLGGTDLEAAFDVAVDPVTREVVLAGYSTGPGSPVKNARQPAYGGGASDAYVARFDPLAPLAADTLVFATYLGGGVTSGFDIAWAAAVDRNGYAFVTGITDEQAAFPTLHPLAGPLSGRNHFLTVYAPDGGAYLYSTFIGNGGKGDGEGHGVAVDALGRAYVAGDSWGSFTPVNAFDPTPDVGPDAIAALVSPYTYADTDSDFIQDADEAFLGLSSATTNGMDEDLDSVPDADDVFPTDPTAWSDLDWQEFDMFAAAGIPDGTEAGGVNFLAEDVVEVSHDHVAWATVNGTNYSLYMQALPRADTIWSANFSVTGLANPPAFALSDRYFLWAEWPNQTDPGTLHLRWAAGGTTRADYPDVLPSNGGVDGGMDIDGDLAVLNIGGEVYVWDITLEALFHVATGSNPKVSGTRILFEAKGGLSLLDLTAPVSTPLLVDADGTSGDIFGDQIVYERYFLAANETEIYSSTIDVNGIPTTPVLRSTMGDGFSELAPKIQGNTVVWFKNDDAGPGPNYVVWDFGFFAGGRVEYPADGRWPTVYQDTFAWPDWFTGQRKIYVFTGDGIGPSSDNCPTRYNLTQSDLDSDGSGDACDPPPAISDLAAADVPGDAGGAIELSWTPPGTVDVIEQRVGRSTTSGGLSYTQIATLPATDSTYVDATPADGVTFYYAVFTSNGETEITPSNEASAQSIDNTTSDTDGDGVPDAVDNCPNDFNPDQAESDGDGIGDACDDDSDNDGILDDGDGSGIAGDNPCTGGNNVACDDNCPAPGQHFPSSTNYLQNDFDGDGVGDACDVCPGVSDASQEDADGDGIGDACDLLTPDPPVALEKPGGGGPPNQTDTDGDGIYDVDDNCPNVANTNQADGDNDGTGDVCDKCPEFFPTVDGDSDGIPDDDSDFDGWCESGPFNTDPSLAMVGTDDNCTVDFNPGQEDLDQDMVGDACDDDVDGDNILDAAYASVCTGGNNTGCNDNCPLIVNTDQADTDVDGIGDACDPSTVVDPYEFHYKLNGDLGLFGTWLPNTLGETVTLTAELYNRDTATVLPDTVTLTVLSVSSDTGRYENDTQAVSGDDFGVVGGGTSPLSLTVDDYAARLTLQVSATATDGATPVYVLDTISFPLDQDGDGLPDAWEALYGGNLNPGDDNDTSLGNSNDGDGLTALQEYRGFVWGPPLVEIPEPGSHTFSSCVIPDSRYQTIAWVPDPDAPAAHFRGDPGKKDLFIKHTGFGGTCADESTVPYSVSNPPPFALGDAYNAIGLAVHVREVNPADPTEDEDNIDVVLVTNDLVNTYIFTDGLIHKLGVRDWTWSTKGSSTIGDSVDYGTDTNLYQISLDNYIRNHPYRDSSHEDFSWDGDGGLDNLATVEDGNDDGVLKTSGPPSSIEDDDMDGYFDGDYYIAAWPTGLPADLVLTVFDVDSDELVELPVVADPSAIGLENTMAQVIKHTISHEVGHAIAAAGTTHLSVPNGLMYVDTWNWMRDGYFSDPAKANIWIHNN